MHTSKRSREERAAQRLAALGNPTRLRLFKLLVKAGHGGLNVGEVQGHLRVPPSTLAHHLSALVQAGLTVQSRKGREVITTANYESMNDLLAYLTDQCCSGVASDSTDAAA